MNLLPFIRTKVLLLFYAVRTMYRRKRKTGKQSKSQKRIKPRGGDAENGLGGLIFRQFFVLKIRRTEKSQQSISEQVRIVTIIESKFEFIEIPIQMLHAQFVVRTNHRPLKEAPDVL